MRATQRLPLYLVAAALMAAWTPLAAVAASCGGGSSAPPGLPTPAELESLGARIGVIDIEVEDIFDPGKPGESALPYRLANDLHVRTRVDAIRSQLLFGERGYPLKYQSGTGSVLLSAEERFYADWYPLRLFHVGAAAFADAGRTWGNDVAGEAPLGWLTDVGVGLRIGNARSGLGNVLHFDVAVPLSGRPGIDSVQFLVETRRSF